MDRADRVASIDKDHYLDYRDHIIRIPKGEKFNHRDEDG